jgi:ribosomal protein S18 acetylase RimI-like enzyme
MSDPLDNPTWHALTGRQAGLALGNGRARRVDPAVAVFGAAIDDDPESWAELGVLFGNGSNVILNRSTPMSPPTGWTAVWQTQGLQMLLDRELGNDDAPGTRPLTHDDVDEMIALVALTEPGPFGPRTIEFGGYHGVFDDGRLVAMAGRRISLDGYTEISAVCTHPSARRRGLAGAITTTVAREILAEGDTPILHVAQHNVAAQRLYERLGFVTRTTLTFALLRAPEG